MKSLNQRVIIELDLIFRFFISVTTLMIISKFTEDRAARKRERVPAIERDRGEYR